jgi:hypothetical protein
MVGVEVRLDLPGFRNFAKHVKAAMAVGVQDAAVATELIVMEEVLLQDAFDTYSLLESIYVSLYGYSTYEEKAAAAADAALNNETKWPEIREWRIAHGPPEYLELDPKVTSASRYDAWVAVCAAHGKYVENGYISWYGNWVPARPFFEAASRRAVPVVMEILYKALYDAMFGNGPTGATP